MFDNRIFVKLDEEQPAELEQNSKANRRELFSGLTQEQVEMDRRVRIEHKEMLVAVASEASARSAKDEILQQALDALQDALACQAERITALEKKVKCTVKASTKAAAKNTTKTTTKDT